MDSSSDMTQMILDSFGTMSRKRTINEIDDDTDDIDDENMETDDNFITDRNIKKIKLVNDESNNPKDQLRKQMVEIIIYVMKLIQGNITDQTIQENSIHSNLTAAIDYDRKIKISIYMSDILSSVKFIPDINTITDQMVHDSLSLIDLGVNIGQRIIALIIIIISLIQMIFTVGLKNNSNNYEVHINNEIQSIMTHLRTYIGKISNIMENLTDRERETLVVDLQIHFSRIMN
ncbi:MAG: hypothetical protein Terrestrivirus5_31 [Terrestrivirus sp.]|uniref:Uncharacterized protein n=1 Tax=Terrestrivirus sp. TaxID=2487775 RepID=A0A3G4ZS12_9VIRU|nr:MAG: hypothetical protein Terrestrivirus5_31 [Terrestrivirus sp.]